MDLCISSGTPNSNTVRLRILNPTRGRMKPITSHKWLLGFHECAGGGGGGALYHNTPGWALAWRSKEEERLGAWFSPLTADVTTSSKISFTTSWAPSSVPTHTPNTQTQTHICGHFQREWSKVEIKSVFSRVTVWSKSASRPSPKPNLTTSQEMWKLGGSHLLWLSLPPVELWDPAVLDTLPSWVTVAGPGPPPPPLGCRQQLVLSSYGFWQNKRRSVILPLHPVHPEPR